MRVRLGSTVGAELTDPRSARVKRLRRLTRRKSRADAGQFLAEGEHAVEAALAAHRDGRVHVHEVLVTTEADARHERLTTDAGASSVPVTSASAAVLAALSETVTPQGIVAVVDALDVPLQAALAEIEQTEQSSPALVAVLADVRDPGNAGTLVRVADAAGADAVVFAGDSVDPYNGKVVRASVGSLFHLPIVTGVPVSAAIDELRAAGLQVVVADGAADLDLNAPDAVKLLARPTAWVFGNEAWGVPEDLRAEADAVVAVPIYGSAESLNVATAAALCLYASARVRRAG
ncbi:MAG TPA: RNA methyltransferase [Actinomycetes bacterium]|nr:RNA methyltransferase [Actinomycetes bacterium]